MEVEVEVEVEVEAEVEEGVEVEVEVEVEWMWMWMWILGVDCEWECVWSVKCELGMGMGVGMGMGTGMGIVNGTNAETRMSRGVSRRDLLLPKLYVVPIYICKATDSDREGNLVYALEYIAQRPVPVENRVNPAFSSPFQYFSSSSVFLQFFSLVPPPEFLFYFITCSQTGAAA